MKIGMQPANIRLYRRPNYDKDRKSFFFDSVHYTRKYFFSEPHGPHGQLDGVAVHIQWMVMPKNHMWKIVGSASEGSMEKLSNEGWGVVDNFRGWRSFEIDRKTCSPTKFVAHEPAESSEYETTPPPSFRAQVVIEKIITEFCKWKSKHPENELIKQFTDGTFHRGIGQLRSRLKAR